MRFTSKPTIPLFGRVLPGSEILFAQTPEVDPVVVDGRVMPVAIIYTGTCEEVAAIETGVFVVDTEDATTLAGNLDYTVSGTARSLPFEVMLTE